MPVPTLSIQDTAARISWSHPNLKDVFRWVVYFRYNDKWDFTVVNRGERSVVLPLTITVNKAPARLTMVSVTAVDRTGNESKPAALTISK